MNQLRNNNKNAKYMYSVYFLFCSLLVPMDQLTCESALYWQAVCKYLHGMGNEGDEFMEKVLPTCVDYCSYVKRLVYWLVIVCCSDSFWMIYRTFRA